MSRAACVVALIVTLIGTAGAQSSETLFPRPAELEPAIRFWTRVYTEVDTSSGFLHDPVNLKVVYATLNFSRDPSPRERRRITARETEKYRDILNKLGSGNQSALSTDEARVLALWPKDTSNEDFRKAADRIRFQLGQADRFKAGLLRSGRWKPYIQSILEERGVPAELASLPHVESSFDPTAYSKVGAAGLWQFMRSTGLRYMQIDHIIDERRDPFLSTKAAARLLHDNFSVIQSWPLAITAYNHGLAGMRRAVAQQGTSDIGVIAHKYTSRTFGFASRNFYTAFLAALDVDRNAERYFGPLNIDPPEDLLALTLPDYVDVAPLAQAFNISQNELQRLNPALTEAVWSGDKYVPRGFELRVPRRPGTDPAALLAAIPSNERYAAQRPDLQHRVRSGETLSGIAQTYRVSLAGLMRTNGIDGRGFIRAGQVLNLPVAANSAAVALAAASVGTASAAGAPVGDAAGGEYVVRSGDSIDRIARRLRIDQAALLSVNNIDNRNRIYPGQVLRIPGQSAESRDLPALAASAVDTLIAPAAPPEADVPAGDVEAAAEAILAADVEAAAEAILASDVDAENAEAEVNLESNVLGSTQATLAADPSDYTVADNDTIEVQAEETLGHYADWLEIRTQRLRDVNRMPFERAVVYGQRIRLDFSRVDRKVFEARRIAYQEQRQESFFLAYQIADIQDHVIRSGESLWVLARRTYDVPVWLLRQYNPDLELDRVNPGTVVKFPRLERIAPEAEPVLTAREVG
jgi:membrane-bound lytic murein transglycosylase D